MFSVKETAELTQVLRAAARVEILPRFRNLEEGAIRTKSGPLDLVTVADEAAEALISEGLERLFPGAVIIGEEACAKDESVLGRLAQADLAIVVDPIDGTSNYAAGVPLFGVMAAVISHGEVVASVIHDPITDHSSVAVRGEGAWSEGADGARRGLKVADAVAPGRMTGNASWRYLPVAIRDRVARNLTKVAASWDYRCAAAEYRVLASGHCHFLIFNRLMPWDHLAGWLLHQEAGGYSAHFDGTPYRPTDLEGGLLYAPDRESWHALHDTLFAD
nr:inositol monophosphatase family protein [uncultured Lichenicoccus sp.]